MSLKGKNIIITGATSGFGLEFASTLSAEGASVFIGGRRADRGAEVAKDTNSTFHLLDVADEDSNKSFFSAAEKHFGDGQNVDFILLNAGVEGNTAETVVPTLDIKAFDYIFGVNVRGMVLGIQYGTPLLRKGGTFLCTSSTASLVPMGAAPIYAGSKGAVDTLVRCYAANLAESEDERLKSLSIMSMNPSFFITDMAKRFTGFNEDVEMAMAKMFNPSQRPGDAKELAGTVLELCQGKLPYKSGSNFVVDADTHFPTDEYTSRLQKVKKNETNNDV